MKQLVLIALLALLFASCHKTDPPRSYTVKTHRSKVEWKGSAPDHFHTGSFDVNGFVLTSFGGGTFTIPIASIEHYDLQ